LAYALAAKFLTLLNADSVSALRKFALREFTNAALQCLGAVTIDVRTSIL
jgi:hypothetical protein